MGKVIPFRRPLRPGEDEEDRKNEEIIARIRRLRLAIERMNSLVDELRDKRPKPNRSHTIDNGEK